MSSLDDDIAVNLWSHDIKPEISMFNETYVVSYYKIAEVVGRVYNYGIYHMSHGNYITVLRCD